MMHNENKYENYQAEDFAQDERFISWVKTTEAAEDEFWKEWQKKHPEKDDEIYRAKALIRLMQSPEKEVSEGQIESMWRKIDVGMGKQQPQSREIQASPAFWQMHRWKFAAAAMISVLLISFFLLKNNHETVRTAVGQQLAYTLPDQSVVTLNAGSEITFDPESWDSKREIQLKGEAFFEVEKGSRFQVISEHGTVAVLGTSFNVYARDEKLEVACYTGKVQVSDRQGKIAEILLPGKGVLLENNEVRTFEVEPEANVNWMLGEFIYDDVPLVEVLQELKRQYKLDVELQTDILGRKYSGQFTNKDLKGALQMICLPMELTYTLDSANNKVIIRQE